jgi:hypothetical protein
MTGDVTVGSTRHLIVAAGTKIIADPGVEFVVNAGRIEANGEEDNPIRFCGKEATAGYWDGVNLIANDPESYIDWTLIADGGGDTAEGALAAKTNLPLHHIRVENSGNVGVYATEWGFQSVDLTVTTSVGEALILTTEVALRDLPLGGTFTGNGKDQLRWRAGTLNEVITMWNLGLTYQLENSLVVTGSSELTIEAGVEILMEAERYIELGWNSQAPLVLIEGTPEAPVILRGRLTGPGFWGGIIFQAGIRAGSEINNLVVQDAGFDRPAIDLKNTIPIDGLTLEGNADISLDVADVPFHSATKGISIADSTGKALVIHPGALTSLPADTAFANNNSTYIEITGGSLVDSGTIPALTLPYYVEDWFNTHSSVVVSIAPGTHFLMGDDAYILFGWNQHQNTVHMNGTAEDPIVFDHILGDAGKFRYLQLGGNTSADSTLNYVHIKNAGFTGFGSLYHNSNIAIPASNISNCTFENSASSGIYLGGDLSEDYSGNGNTFVNNVGADIAP